MSLTIDRLTAALGRSYRLERELGHGGMATVYLAHDSEHERPEIWDPRSMRRSHTSAMAI